MPLCLLALVGVPLLLTLGTSHARFQELYALESDWIALDNAAIELGRSARAVWNGLQKANAEIRRLETRHHLVHACARVPATAIQCRTADLAAEGELALRHARAGVAAATAWRVGAERARVQAPTALFSRLPLPPLQSVRCSVCGLPSEWEIGVPRLESVQLLRGMALRVRWVGRSLRGGGQWDYAIEEGEDG